MKKMTLSLSLLVLASLFNPSASQAEEVAQGKFFNTSDIKIKKLEELHIQAENLITTNDFKSALKVYDEILLTEPDDEVAYTNMGHIYLILGEYGRATNAFQNALYINSENETALQGLEKIADPDKPKRDKVAEPAEVPATDNTNPAEAAIQTTPY